MDISFVTSKTALLYAQSIGLRALAAGELLQFENCDSICGGNFVGSRAVKLAVSCNPAGGMLI
jgi:hypothetical protein